MKKSLIALLLALAVALTGTVYTFVTVSRGIDQVVYTRRTVTGDPAAADGLTLQHKITHSGYLHWDSLLTFADGEHSTETTFRYTPDRENEYIVHDSPGVMLYNHASWEIDASLPPEKHRGFSRLARELYDEVGPGGSGYRKARLSEVYDYYPIQIQVDFPQNFFNSDEMLYMEDNWQSEEYHENWLKLNLAFETFFRIPILTDEEYEISVDRDSGHGGGYGSAFGMSLESQEEDRYNMDSFSVRKDNDAWFTFSTHTVENQVVDTSLIPGGYGIYHLACDPNVTTYSEKPEGILVDDMKCIYPMDPAVEVKALQMSADDTRLLVCYLDDTDTLWTDVVDIATGTRLQRLELYTGSGEYEPWTDVIVYEDCILYLADNKQLILLVDNGAGYDLVLNVPQKELENVYYSPYNTQMGWDGHRLALATKYGDAYDSCDISLAIYTADGIQYAGAYTGTLTSNNRRCNNAPYDGYPKIVSMK